MAKRIIPYLVLISMVAGGIAWMNAQYAPLAAVQKLEKRVTLNELLMIRRQLQAQLYFLQDQLIKYPGSIEIKHRIETVKNELQELNDQIKAIKIRSKKG